MHTYAQVLTYAIPFFFVLILIEYAISKKMKVTTFRSFDTVSSLSSGLTNSIKEVLGLAVVIISYSWMVDHIAITSIESTPVIYIATFIGLDFAGYWAHRFEHEINILWNRHIIHHSSEEFNLACALRQNISAVFGIFFFLLIPLAVIGIPAEVIAIVAPLHLFAQFWYHTRLIDKMGVLEHILVTPSHHRVHHAINDRYLDKNFSQVFIIWDKIFGTFQSELADEPAVYGVKRAVSTWNPILINFQHFSTIISDAWHTRMWSDKLRVFYMPTGWRPEDRLRDAPIDYVIVATDQTKYDTPASFGLHAWIWTQLVITVFLMLFMFSVIDDFHFGYLILYGLFLMLSIFSYSSLMDRSGLSYIFEGIKLILALVMIIYLGGWFGLDNLIAYGSAMMVLYLILSMLLNFYFMKNEVQLKPTFY